VVLLIASMAHAAPAPAPAPKPTGTTEGAKAVIESLRTAKDGKAATMALKPSSADYKAVFADDVASLMEKQYEEAWSGADAVITPSEPAETDVILFKATTEELRDGANDASKFANGWKRISGKLRLGVVWYGWKFVKKGQTTGTAFEGLVFVNGHWAIFPRPWKRLKSAATPTSH
jgi:hypothetical protein